MFHLNQAALLSVQLLLVCHARKAIHLRDHKLVSRGESVTFTCNISMENITQINWTKDRFLFAYLMIRNQTFSNFPSDRLRIDTDFPSKLNIVNVQREDAGLYRCNVTDQRGTRTAEWNLTVSEEAEEIYQPVQLWYFLYILTPVVGFLLCVITSVCLCRKLKTGARNQDPVQDQHELQTGGEAALPQQQGHTGRRTNNKSRTQYAERLNSIYGLY